MNLPLKSGSEAMQEGHFHQNCQRPVFLSTWQSSTAETFTNGTKASIFRRPEVWFHRHLLPLGPVAIITGALTCQSHGILHRQRTRSSDVHNDRLPTFPERERRFQATRGQGIPIPSTRRRRHTRPSIGISPPRASALLLGQWASGSPATAVGACRGGAGFKPDDAGR